MFGTLRPRSCRLEQDSVDTYQRFYCGLCKSLGDGYGAASRALVSHDAVFLGLLVDALSHSASAHSQCRCPLLPVIQRKTVVPDGPPMRFAAAVQMLLGDQWLADRALEGKRLAGLLRPLARRHVSVANASLRDLGVRFDALGDFDLRQAACERLGAGSVLEASRPTEDALALVFASIASLPGIRAEAGDEATRVSLSSIGAAVGRVIYLADALEDLDKDLRKGDFNPCIDVRRGVSLASAQRVEEAGRRLAEALATLRDHVPRLPLARHRALIEEVLLGRLASAAKAALAIARARVTAGPPARRPAWLSAGVRRALMLAAFVLAWLVGQRASLAAPPRAPPKAGPKASAAPSASASAPAPSASVGPPEDAPEDATEAPPPTRPPAPGFRPRQPAAPALPPEDPGPQQPGAPPCNVCSDCCNGCGQAIKDGCNGCVSGCGKCGDSCKGCGDCCNGCGKCGSCGDCCSGCGDCGSCKGCGDCGSCGGCKGCGGCGGKGGCC